MSKPRLRRSNPKALEAPSLIVEAPVWTPESEDELDWEDDGRARVGMPPWEKFQQETLVWWNSLDERTEDGEVISRFVTTET